MNDYKNRKVLFICIGNICRSTMAESVLKNLIKEHKELNWEVDSAALRSWNIGCSPEERCIKILKENGLNSNHITREIEADDFNKFDFIFGMDESNMRELNERAPKNSKAKIILLGSYGDPKDKIIEDPYYEPGDGGFRKCYDQITLSCTNFIKEQLKDKN